MTLSLSVECLNGCSGCEVALLDLMDELLDPAAGLRLVHLPLLMDHRHRDPLEPDTEPVPPLADIGLISGGLRTTEHLATARLMRKRCRIIIALGTCATHGGIPALANLWPKSELLDRCLAVDDSPDGGVRVEPDEDALPALLSRTYALDEALEVDYLLAGCPPHAEAVAEVVRAAAGGRATADAGRSVCDTCPTRRGTGRRPARLERGVGFPADQAELPLSELTCLLEQGRLCLGPVTSAGCARPVGTQSGPGVPGCIQARVGCRGCHGPLRPGGNQLLDLLNALASGGLDMDSLIDRPGVLRFSGAHNRLRTRSAAGDDREE